MKTLFVVHYSGPFGFIKPWGAVRDNVTLSQTFLSPSTVCGISQKLFGIHEPGRILRHRLTFSGTSEATEVTQNRSWTLKKEARMLERPRAILSRNILVAPRLTLAFATETDAVQASQQTICLIRNEDLLLPDGDPIALTPEAFDALPGIECLRVESTHPDAFCVGYRDHLPIYARLLVTPNPTQPAVPHWAFTE